MMNMMMMMAIDGAIDFPPTEHQVLSRIFCEEVWSHHQSGHYQPCGWTSAQEEDFRFSIIIIVVVIIIAVIIIIIVVLFRSAIGRFLLAQHLEQWGQRAKWPLVDLLLVTHAHHPLQVQLWSTTQNPRRSRFQEAGKTGRSCGECQDAGVRWLQVGGCEWVSGWVSEWVSEKLGQWQLVNSFHEIIDWQCWWASN